MQAQIKELLKHIEEVNEEEQAEYGDDDLEEMGGNGQTEVNSALLQKKIDELNQKLRELVRTKRETQSARKALKKLEGDCLVRLKNTNNRQRGWETATATPRPIRMQATCA